MDGVRVDRALWRPPRSSGPSIPHAAGSARRAAPPRKPLDHAAEDDARPRRPPGTRRAPRGSGAGSHERVTRGPLSTRCGYRCVRPPHLRDSSLLPRDPSRDGGKSTPLSPFQSRNEPEAGHEVEPVRQPNRRIETGPGAGRVAGGARLQHYRSWRRRAVTAHDRGHAHVQVRRRKCCNGCCDKRAVRGTGWPGSEQQETKRSERPSADVRAAR